MPLLHSLIQITEGTPGFLLPLFKPYVGANFELIQQIDPHNKISGFEQVRFKVDSYNNPPQRIEVQVGEEAIWAFQDHQCHQHVGTATEIRALGLQLLERRKLSYSPMAEAEMAAFCDAENHFPEVLVAAYDSLKLLSQSGASTWRDTVLFLPRIKEDIARQVRSNPTIKSQIDEIVVLTHNQKTHIFASATIERQVKSLPRWKDLGKIFGIEHFHIHVKAPPERRKSDEHPEWMIYGVGGVARHVITKSPFKGQNTRFSEFPENEGAIARAPVKFSSSERKSEPSHLVIAVLTSDTSEAYFANITADRFAPPGALKHAINVRPLSFGPPRNNKPSPSVLREHLSEFDYLWIIANHRQRHTGGFAVGLSMSSMASRFVKATAQALIDCLSNDEGQALLRSTFSRRKFGLVGSVRFLSELSSHELIRRVLYSMLCEDAYLHSAERIVILWPHRFNASERFRNIRLGSHKYKVELIERSRNPRNLSIVALALDVQRSVWTQQDFEDFCVSLLAGYGWELRAANRGYMLLENEGEAMRVWPIQSVDEIHSRIYEDIESQGGDLIITNQSLTRSLRQKAKIHGWSLIHYSELSTWMSREYNLTVHDVV